MGLHFGSQLCKSRVKRSSLEIHLNTKNDKQMLANVLGCDALRYHGIILRYLVKMPVGSTNSPVHDPLTSLIWGSEAVKFGNHCSRPGSTQREYSLQILMPAVLLVPNIIIIKTI